MTSSTTSPRSPEHHTLLPVEPIVNGTVQHVSPAHEIAAAGAVALTILTTILTVATRRVKIIKNEGSVAG